MKSKIIQELKNKNIVILGFGREGKSTYNFIISNKIPCLVTIADKLEIENRKELEANGVKVITGENYLNNLEQYDLIIKTPGISFKDLDVSSIRSKITSQTEIFLKYAGEKIVGITGTKGKSTTSSLIYEMLKTKYKTVLVGNIGLPAFEMIDKYDETDWYVYELSSHQLEFVNYSPKIAILLNMFEEHLDHYISYDAYKEAKRNIFKYQNQNDWYIYNYDDKNIINEDKKLIQNTISVTNKFKIDKNYAIYSENEIELLIEGRKYLINIPEKRSLKGIHNIFNISVAVAVAKLLEIEDEKLTSVIQNFKSLPHRLETIGTYNGVTYIDDSIATIPQAVISAVESQKEVDTVIIGGMDRGIDYTILIDYLKKGKVNNVILMYDTGKIIYDRLNEIDYKGNIYYLDNLECSVKLACSITKKGKICLMSPAAASYGVFKNFEERGDKFKEYVEKYSKIY